MKKYWKKTFFFFLITVLAILLALAAQELITFEALKKNADALELYVRRHYVIAVFALAGAHFATAFFSPGAVILTLAGGFLFGAAGGAFYASAFSTAGCTLAFLLSRHVIGTQVLKSFEKRHKRFEEEMNRHESNYLFVLRIVPVMPSFAINYLAGVTPISTLRFGVTTLLGVIPGAVVYSFAGSKLAELENAKDILSTNVIVALALLAALALVPVLYDQLRRRQ